MPPARRDQPVPGERLPVGLAEYSGILVKHHIVVLWSFFCVYILVRCCSGENQKG